MVKERNQGIDLLRFVLMFMICIMHTLKHGGILDATQSGTLSYDVLWLIEIFAFCAVDGFALISGYTASDKPRKYEKLVEMWFQVFFYSFVLSLFLMMLGRSIDWTIGQNIRAIDIVKLTLPVTFSTYWYFTAYVALFFAAPMLNKYVFSMDRDAAKKVLIIMILLYSIIGVINDPFQTNGGMSAIWLMILYTIGAVIKKAQLFEKKPSWFLVLLIILSTAFTWITCLIVKTKVLLNYVSPTILLNAVALLLLFSRIKIRSVWIGRVTPLVFGIYLFQLNPIIWNDVICNAFTFVANQNVIVSIIGVLGLAFVIFASGLIIEFIRANIAGWIHIQVMCRSLIKVCEKVGKCIIDLLPN